MADRGSPISPLSLTQRVCQNGWNATGRFGHNPGPCHPRSCYYKRSLGETTPGFPSADETSAGVLGNQWGSRKMRGLQVVESWSWSQRSRDPCLSAFGFCWWQWRRAQLANGVPQWYRRDGFSFLSSKGFSSREEKLGGKKCGAWMGWW